jgi:hypothetical protein
MSAMPALRRKHRHFGFAGAGIGASAGPLSLLLLPKCPLCLLPLLALLGIVLPASTGLWILAGLLVAAWLAILFMAARRHPLVLVAACASGLASVVAVALHSRSLLWTAVLAMTLTGIALMRACTHGDRHFPAFHPHVGEQ